MRLLILPLFLSWSLTISAVAEQFTGRVVGVSDGDTISVMHDGKAEKIRLHKVDAPESSQAFGNRAKQFTSDMVFGKDVTVTVADKDRYGRTVGVVTLSDECELNRELVRHGFAWWYRAYAKNDKELAELEKQARNDGLGLWADKDPTPPWDFRKQKKPKPKNNKRGETSNETTTGTTATTKSDTRKSSGSEVLREKRAPAELVRASSKRFHRPGCKSLKQMKSGGTEMTREKAVSKGLDPCKACEP